MFVRLIFSLLLPFLTADPGQAQGPFDIYGVHVLAWNPEGYGSVESVKALDEIKELGARWIVLVPAQAMPDSVSTQIIRNEGTADDEALLAAAKYAKSLGLKVVLKPHINSSDGIFRGYIRPSDPAAWFESYRAFILHYAQMAQEMNADAFVIGTELFSMTRERYKSYWQQIIRDTRAQYNRGFLTYSAFFLEWDSVPFWGDLDAIGISAYFPMGLPGSGSSRARLTRVWREHYIPRLRAASIKHNKRVIFSEFGISSQREAYVFPWVYRHYNRVDLQLQIDYFGSLFDAFKDQGGWFLGFWQWGWTVHTDNGGPADFTHALEGKPALEVLRQAFSGS